MLVVSSFYAALIGFLCVVLSVMVVRQRIARRISIGDGGNEDMGRVTRVFGNFVEYAPLFVVLMAITESGGFVSDTVLHVFGAAFVVGRVAHAFGLYRTLGINPGRTIGLLTTLGTILGLSIILLMAALPRL